MKEVDQTPDEFCEVIGHYTGRPIKKLAHILEWTMSGTEMYELCQFYFAKVYSRFLSEEIRRKDNTIYRQRCIIWALCIIITMLLIK